MVKQARHAGFEIGRSHSRSGPVELPRRLACPPTSFLPVQTSRRWWELPTVTVPGHTWAFRGRRVPLPADLPLLHLEEPGPRRREADRDHGDDADHDKRPGPHR
jgi:hypothetical protein